MLPNPLMIDDNSPSNSSFKKPKIEKGEDRVNEKTKTVSCPSRGPTVTFCKRVRVKKVRSHKLFSAAERYNSWYTPEEYLAIRGGCVKTLKMMRSGEPFEDTDNYSSRGLEVRTPEAAKSRKESKATALQAVLDEQEFQQDGTDSDPEKIRAAYRETSVIAQNVAEFIGTSDREAIFEYLLEDPSI